MVIQSIKEYKLSYEGAGDYRSLALDPMEMSTEFQNVMSVDSTPLPPRPQPPQKIDQYPPKTRKKKNDLSTMHLLVGVALFTHCSRSW